MSGRRAAAFQPHGSAVGEAPSSSAIECFFSLWDGKGNAFRVSYSMGVPLTQTGMPQTIHLTNGKTVVARNNDAWTADLIPTIDVGHMYSPNLDDRKIVAEKIRAASCDIGFFTIVGHGIDVRLSQKVLEQAKFFFERPLNEKLEVAADLMPNEFCGYHPLEHYNISAAKKRDLHETYNWNYDASRDPAAPDPTVPAVNLWPADMPHFREALLAYQVAMIRLARKLTRMFALALHLPEGALDEFIKVPEAGARVLHYPAQRASRDDQNGIGAHTDVEYFTIVNQESSGLEVLGKDGRWVKVPPVPRSFVVNIADCFMRQSNDLFVSTVHRVINESGRERYSIPFFWGFDRRTVMNPFETCVDSENSPKYEIMTAGEYYLWRTREQRKQWKA